MKHNAEIPLIGERRCYAMDKTALGYLIDGYDESNPEPAAPDYTEAEELPVDDKPTSVVDELPLFVRLAQGFAELGFKGEKSVGD